VVKKVLIIVQTCPFLSTDVFGRRPPHCTKNGYDVTVLSPGAKATNRLKALSMGVI